jgi:hypothetical protein
MPEYIINIARHGFHWAKYVIGSGRNLTEDGAVAEYEDVVGRYPPREGFSISLSVWHNIGKDIIRSTKTDS